MVVVAVLAIAVIGVGCGGGGNGVEVAIPKPEFVKRASVVCQKASRRIKTEFAAYLNGGKSKEVERAEKAGEMTTGEAASMIAEEIVIPAMREERDAIRLLGIPAGDKGRAVALVAAFRSGVEEAEAHPQKAAEDGTDAFGRQERLAREYGLDGC
ncbi:MAG: hypothetical protein ACRDLL_09615 [Solirubrobacterales bacterium]